MIVGIRGKIVKLEPTHLHMDVGGLIYEIFISINCSNECKPGEERELKITQIFREDAQQLYGFYTQSEKSIFDTLIKINGVGPKVAIATLSTFRPQTFMQIISSKDAKMLQKIPGIGAKGANRIMVELGGANLEEITTAKGAAAPSNNQEAVMALESLGFKKEQINKALKDVQATDTSGMVKEALAKLQR